jgi:hypothetical protein
MGIFQMGFRPLVERWPPHQIKHEFVEPTVWSYWDTIFAEGGKPLADHYQPFSMPRGAQDPLLGRVKTHLETNMITKGSEYGFGETRSLLVERLVIRFPLSLPTSILRAILDSCYLSFQIAEKITAEWSLRALASPEITRTGEIVLPWQVRYIPPRVPFVMWVGFPETPFIAELKDTMPIMVPLLEGICDAGVA